VVFAVNYNQKGCSVSYKFVAAALVMFGARTAFAQTVEQLINDSPDGQHVFFEQGLYPHAETFPVGLPPSGIINGQSDPSSTFLLQPYTANNVLMLQAPSASATDPSTGRMTFTTPTMARSIDIATTSGFGANYFQITVHFSNDTPDQTWSSVASPDWLTSNLGLPFVVSANALVKSSGQINDPSIYSGTEKGIVEIYALNLQFNLATPEPVSSVDFTYVKTTSIDITPYHKTAFFGISTSSDLVGPYTAADLTPSSFNADIVVEDTPEPAAVFMVIVGTAPLVTRRRRNP
jgi:hypothetical protein